MKKFTENKDKKTKIFAGDKLIENNLYDLIEDTLKAKLDDEDSDKLTLVGVKKLTEELSKIVKNKVTEEKINVLKNFKNLKK